MSTKTSIKRIAAVAAVALTLGGFSAVSANATTTNPGDVLVTAAQGTNNFSSSPAATETATATAGANNYVGILVASKDNAPVVLTVTGGTAASASTYAVGSGTASLTLSGTSDHAKTDIAVNIPTPTVGTVVVKTYTITNGLQSSTASTTLTITVSAAATGVGTLSVGNSKAYITSVDASAATPTQVDNVITKGTIDNTGTTALAADVAILAAKGSAGTSALAGAVYGILNDSQVPTAAGMAGKTLTATISGSGLITGNSGTDTNLGTTPARVATTVTSTTNAGEYAFNVYSDGSAGTGTITVSYTDSSNVTTVVATKTITFYGAQATFTPTVKYSYIPNSGAAYPAAGTRTATAADATTSFSTPSKYAYDVAIKALDAAGNPVAGVTPLVKSADTTIISAGTCTASSTTSGTSYCSLTGVSGAHGKVTLTFYTGSAATFDLVSTTADITVSSAAADSFVITADASATSGQVITYTITAKDMYGNPIPDGSLVSAYTSATVSGGAMKDYAAAVNGDPSQLFSGVKFLGGVATDTVQAPFGTTTIVGDFLNIGGGVATLADSHFTTVALTNAETIVKTSVGGSSDAAAQAAVDAANEATDAANAATDAANNAMDSADAAQQAALDAGDKADAALAAVTDLATKVSAIASQIASLSALVKKIAAKVKA